MAEKKKSSASFTDTFAFIAVCLGGIALFVATILGFFDVSVGLINVLRTIADIVGWAVLCLLSYNFIKSKKTIWMWVIWVIAVVMIVFGIIMRLF